MSEKVYCESCINIEYDYVGCVGGVGGILIEFCRADKNKFENSTYYTKGYISKKPLEINKNNDCKWYIQK